MRQQKGQVLVAAILLLMVITILIPVMVGYVQNESKWSVKEKENTTAFHLAEGSIDKAYQYVTSSTTTWKSIQNGNIQTGYAFDTAYTDMSGGSYTISISSGPGTQMV